MSFDVQNFQNESRFLALFHLEGSQIDMLHQKNFQNETAFMVPGETQRAKKTDTKKAHNNCFQLC